MTNGMPLFDDWTQDFTIAIWDQPNSGATGMRNAHHPGEITLDRYAKDGIAVAGHLRKRFGKRTIALIGISWGTQLGVEMVHRQPPR